MYFLTNNKIAVCILIALVQIFICSSDTLSCGARFYDSEGECAANPSVVVASEHHDSDMPEISVKINNAYGLCGLIARLCYNYDAFQFLYAYIVTDGYVLTYLDKKGKVDFLLEGEFGVDQNVVEMYFCFNRAKDDDCFDKFKFELCDGDGAWFFRENALEYISLDAKNAEIEFSVSDAKGKECFEHTFMNVEGSVAECGDAYLTVKGKFCTNDVLAAGYKVFALNLDSGEGKTMYFVGITGSTRVREDGFFTCERKVLIENKGLYCFIITPVIYTGCDIMYGQRHTRTIEIKTGAC